MDEEPFLLESCSFSVAIVSDDFAFNCTASPFSDLTTNFSHSVAAIPKTNNVPLQ